jgi:ectoine hydroxylase-related dioxygenase (phytanoyl-CoA dioxygenase family)
MDLSVPALSPDAVARELATGRGYCVFERLVAPEEALRAGSKVLSAIQAGCAEDTTSPSNDPRQRQVHGLVRHDPLFATLLESPVLREVIRAALGPRARLITYFANVLEPGAIGQEPHIDYPYTFMRESGAFPVGTWAGTLLNLQMVLMLSRFEERNGGTRIAPGSQLNGAYPDQRPFDERYESVAGEPGDLILFSGLAWHGAGPNRANAPRIGAVAAFTPFFVEPPRSRESRDK